MAFILKSLLQSVWQKYQDKSKISPLGVIKQTFCSQKGAIKYLLMLKTDGLWRHCYRSTVIPTSMNIHPPPPRMSAMFLQPITKPKDGIGCLWSEKNGIGMILYNETFVISASLFSKNQSPLQRDLIEVKEGTGNLQLRMWGNSVHTDNKYGLVHEVESLYQKQECINTFILN